MPLISVTRGSLAYGDVALLESVDLQLEAKERVALIGRNGSGKSSLLAAIAGSRQLDDGEIWRAPGVRIGHVPQEPVLDDTATVFESIVAGMGDISALVGEYHDVSHRLGDTDADTEVLLARLHELQVSLEAVDAWSYLTQAERVIQRFGLDADASVGTLSGGQKKRLALAHALATFPDVLLLDEPTRGIDVGTKSEIYRLMGELAAEGRAVIFVSSYLTELLAVCDRVAVMARGRLQAIRPASEWTAEAVMSVAVSGEN